MLPNPNQTKVKIKTDHYTKYVRIPKEWIRELGLVMTKEVVLEMRQKNPLQWEIKIKPVLKTSDVSEGSYHNRYDKDRNESGEGPNR